MTFLVARSACLFLCAVIWKFLRCFELSFWLSLCYNSLMSLSFSRHSAISWAICWLKASLLLLLLLILFFSLADGSMFCEPGMPLLLMLSLNSRTGVGCRIYFSFNYSGGDGWPSSRSLIGGGDGTSLCCTFSGLLDCVFKSSYGPIGEVSGIAIGCSYSLSMIFCCLLRDEFMIYVLSIDLSFS